MIFHPTLIAGAVVVEPQRAEDERGFFARVWCESEFARHGIEVSMLQASLSHNRSAGTIRGMHFSRLPAQEGKLVRCQNGRMLDVIVDLRRDQPSYLKQVAVELDDRSHRALYIPPGVAHGFQTLVDDCDVLYMMTQAYQPELAAGVRFDDPAFGIRWPLPVSVISDRDRAYPDFVTDPRS
ncbi:MAG: dTDP-4-keto-6-deoxy-D-glucose epimerase [Panacagrimonas sp.]|nr:dTDP-4-dehydrorhamnose 3,5-epimerase [Panacagrimonas sp.]MCC2658640.1 dTDP-4-keto-6-deoxy-D-glucose epimerase [Panacagrimonas sp.]